MIKKRMTYILFRSVFVISLLFSLLSCSHDSQLINELEPVCYSTEIEPLLQSSCGISGCHATPGNETSFGTNSYSAVMTIVKPGDARGSKLYKVITNIYGDDMMPPNQPLTKEQRTAIMVWIEQGAKNIDCTIDTSSIINPETSDSVCFTQIIQPLLVSSCATTGCHDAGTAKEGVVLTDYTSIKNSDEAVVPYQPGSSKIYKVLQVGADDPMPPPPTSPLTSVQIEYLRQWIADGALNSDCPETTCDTLSDISFSNSVYPVINTACVGCHNATTTNGSVNLSDYSHISDIASTIKNEQSWLVGVIKKADGFIPMPPSSVLSDCDIRKIELWIEQGLKNN